LGGGVANSGTVRETFVKASLSVNHTVTTPAKGDFLLDNFYTLEVGGKNKTIHQIVDMPNPLVIKDDISAGRSQELAMWMLGLLY
ncbi:MAG: AAA family ATPase, partial [Bacteroidota bacterium]